MANWWESDPVVSEKPKADEWWKNDPVIDGGLKPKQKAEEPQAPLPKSSFLRDVGDIGVSALQIGPEAVKGVAQIARLATGDKFQFAKDVEESMNRGTKAIQEVLGSDRYNAQQKRFAAVMNDPNKGVGDMFSYLIDNPGLLVDKSITTIGSMFLPAGAGRLVASGAKALDAAAPTVAKAVTASTVGTTMAQNAASTYSDLKDLPEEARYKGAAVSAAATLLMGVATKGGVEGDIARKLASDLTSGKASLETAKSFLQKTYRTGAKEAAQETGEEAGAIAGEAVAREKMPEPTQAGKRLGLAATLGATVGSVAGGASYQRPTIAPSAEEQPATPPVTPEGAPRPVQKYDAQYFPLDEQGRRIIEAPPEGVTEPTKREATPAQEAAAVVEEVEKRVAAETPPAVVGATEPTAEPVAPAIPEPTKRAAPAAPEIAAEDLDRTKPASELMLSMPDIRRLAQQNGFGPGVTKGPSGTWWEENVAGKTLADVQSLIASDPKLTEGRGARAELLRQMRDSTPAPAVEPAQVQETLSAEAPAASKEAAPEVSVERRRDGVGAKRTVQPQAGVETTTGTEAPAPGGVGSTGQVPAGTDVRTRAEPSAVTVTEAKAEPAPVTVTEAKAEPAPVTITEAKAEPAPVTITEAKAEPAAEPEPAPVTITEAKAEPAAEVKPAPVTITEAKAEPAAEPEPDKELERLRPILPEAALDTDLIDARENWQEISQKKAATEGVAKKSVVSWDALPDESKVEWVQATIDKYTQPKADVAYEKRYMQISEDSKRTEERAEAAKPPVTRESQLVYPTLEAAQEAVTKFDTQIERVKAQREKLVTRDEKGRVIPPEEGSKEDTKWVRLTDQLGKLQDDKAFAERDIDIRRVQVIQSGKKPLFAKSTSIAGVPLPKESVDAFEAGNVSTALEVLGQKGTNNVVRETAAKIAPLLANTKGEIANDVRTPEGRAASGSATTDGSLIQLDRNRGMDEETLVHEGVHAAAERVLSTPDKDLTESQRTGKRELNAVWAAVRNDKSVPLTEEGRKSVSEFSAEAMSRKDVQDALREKPAPEGKGTLWQQFKRAIMKMVGLHQPKNMRDAVVDAMDKVFTAVPEPTTETEAEVAPEREAEAKPEREAAPARVVAPERERQTNTSEFKEFFGESQIVDESGKPKVMYHGTARDISVFKPKQAGAIFLTDKPEFAESFSGMSKLYVQREALRNLTTSQKKQVGKEVLEAFDKDTTSDPANRKKLERSVKDWLKGKITDPSGELRYYAAGTKLVQDAITSGPNIMAVYVRAENPFDYENSEHLAQLEDALLDKDGENKTYVDYAIGRIKEGSWANIEDKKVQETIRKLGFDGFYVLEKDTKNLAVYNSAQIKSATGNIGTFDRENPDIRYSLSPDFEREIENLPKNRQRATAQFVSAASDGLSDLSLGEWLGGWIDRNIRTKLTDRVATLAMRINRVEGAAVRNAMNEVKPLIQLRQAYDTDKLVYDFYLSGGIRFNNDTRQVEIVDADSAPDDVLKAIEAWAEDSGMSFDRAYNTVLPKIFEAVRIYNVKQQAAAEGVKSNVVSHLSEAFIQKAMQEYNADPALQEISRLMDKPRIALLEFGVETGRWTRDEADKLKSVVGYVPFDRIAEAEGLGPAQKRVKGGITSFSDIPKLVGTTEYEVKNVFDNYFNTMAFLMSEAVRNGAAISTLKYTEKLGLAKDLGTNASAIRYPARTVSAFEDGIRHYYELPSRNDALAFKYDRAPMSSLLQILGKVSKAFRMAITLYPTFSAKQFAEDLQRSMMITDVKNVAAVTANATAAYASLIKSQVTGERNPLLAEFGRKGLTAEIDWERKDPASSYLKDRGFTERGMKISGFQVPFTKYIAEAANRLDGIAHASDLAVRSAVYKQVLAESKDEAKAIAAARELINFRRQGSSDVLSTFIPLIPFLNAKLQGMDLEYRAITGRDAASGLNRNAAIGNFATRGAIMMAASTLYALLKAGDDDYENVDREKRDRMWMLPGGYAIPVPAEYGVIFKLIPEYALEYFRRKGTPEEQAASEAFITWFKTMATQFLGGVPVPQQIKPLLENFVNYSFFTNRPLVGKHLEGVEKSEQTVSTTSEFAKQVAQWAKATVPGEPEISPIKIDNFMQGYFGTMASAFTMVMDSFINPDKIDRPLHRIVGLGAFTYEQGSSARKKDEFYELREEAARAYNTLAAIGIQGDSEKYNRYEERMWPVLSAYGMTEGALEALSDVRKNINAIQSNKETIEVYVNEARQAGAKDPVAAAKLAREADIKSLRTTEREITGWVRTVRAEINEHKKKLKVQGINLDAKP